jgi:hypothetical protein
MLKTPLCGRFLNIPILCFEFVSNFVLRISDFLLPPEGGTTNEDDAGARRQGDCLQSSFKRVRLPPAFFSGVVLLQPGPAAHGGSSSMRRLADVCSVNGF